MLKEACVGSYIEAKKAEDLGADRIELCDNLNEGGTTPSLGTIKIAKETISVPIFPIIRPRGGNFIFSEEEIKIMERDIELCKSLNIDGVVIGALTSNNEIDEDVIIRLIEKAKGMNITFHMAFDLIDNRKAAIDKLIQLGVNRILTKGGNKSAMNNLNILRETVEYAGNRINILAGGGITKDNYKYIVDKTCVKEVHGTKIVGKLID
ncbi:copper homeostasis protein CutC [Lachnospiraceae bacterium NSJ-29]|uniref:PF03932 family protein CutC n=1 Tax=Wansuia hejianensis TaxID=2763667 RepID=A0A926EXE8_9FIRM|nr:copper homeostasis protein CutC [Wansuia hejianensis]